MWEGNFPNAKEIGRNEPCGAHNKELGRGYDPGVPSSPYRLGEYLEKAFAQTPTGISTSP